MNSKNLIKVGSDFSGVGAFDQALKRNNVNYKTVFACDMDKFARQSFIANYGEPDYYPLNVYHRKIPTDPLDVYMTSPPCQSFSLAGKRTGKDSDNGVLFFTSYEFIKVNKPRFFIFENVKGLLSDDNGKTFSEWCNMLGGKSINGLPVLFPFEDSVPYHIYHKVLNSKKYGVPQNRERVFIIGIRDDQDNNFTWPKEEHLKLKLKDVLEDNVPDKYFLSDKALNSIILNEDNLQTSKVNPEVANALQSPGNACGIYKGMTAIKVVSATNKGFETAEEGDSINYTNPNSKTRRGRVGKKVAQTLDTACNQGVIVHNIPEIVSVRKYDVDVPNLQTLLIKHKKGVSLDYICEQLDVEKSKAEHWFRKLGSVYFSIPDSDVWFELKKLLEIETSEFDKSIMTFEEREGVFEKSNRVYDAEGIAPTMTATSADERILTDRIRRLTPRECFRLQDFPDDFEFVVSDTQLYKQAGNSITVGVLAKILDKLNL